MAVKSSTKKRLIHMGIAENHAIALATDANLDAIRRMTRDEVAKRTELVDDETELDRVMGIISPLPRRSKWRFLSSNKKVRHAAALLDDIDSLPSYSERPESLVSGWAFLDECYLPLNPERQLVMLGLKDEHAKALTHRASLLDNISRWKGSTIAKRAKIPEDSEEIDKIMSILKLLQMSEKIRQVFILFKNGFSISDVSVIMGVKRGTAYSWHKKILETGAELPHTKGQVPWRGEARPEKLQRIVDLLVTGHHIVDVAKTMDLDPLLCGIWLELPEFNRAWANGPSFLHWKYSAEEIIQLAQNNPSYGFKRFVSSLYPRKDTRDQYYYEFTLLFNDFKEYTGIDLIKNLDEDKSKIPFNWGLIPTEKERRKRWGKRPNPSLLWG